MFSTFALAKREAKAREYLKVVKTPRGNVEKADSRDEPKSRGKRQRGSECP